MSQLLGNIYGGGSGGGATGPTGPTGPTGATGPSGPPGTGTARGVAVYTGDGPLTENPPDAVDGDLYFDKGDYTWTVITVEDEEDPGGGGGTPTGWRYTWNPTTNSNVTPGTGCIARAGAYFLISKPDADGINRDDAIAAFFGAPHTVTVLSADSARGFQITIAANGWSNESGYWVIPMVGTPTEYATLTSGENTYVSIT